MTDIEEGDLTFSFPDHCEAGKYDEWSFYREEFQSAAAGSKAVDILCIADDVAWLIEVKDYRHHGRAKAIDLCDEVAMKVRDTLAGLAAASANADSEHERDMARRALAARRWRVALHLEQPAGDSPLRTRAFDAANIMLKLRSKGRLKAIDAQPVVLDLNLPGPGVPWVVQ